MMDQSTRDMRLGAGGWGLGLDRTRQNDLNTSRYGVKYSWKA